MEPSGVWNTCEDRKIKQTTQKVINHEGLDVSAGLVNGVCDVLKSEINSADHIFNLGAPETINCLNGQLELRDGVWRLKPHKREYALLKYQLSTTWGPQQKGLKRFYTKSLSTILTQMIK